MRAVGWLRNGMTIVAVAGRQGVDLRLLMCDAARGGEEVLLRPAGSQAEVLRIAT
jgi:hypothetical protein